MRLCTVQQLINGTNVLWCCSTATANNVNQTLCKKILYLVCHQIGRLVILTKLIWKSGIWICTDKTRGFLSQFGQIGHHIMSSKGAVQTDAKQIGMFNRVDKSLYCLSRKCSSALVGNGCRNHNGEKVQTAF